MAYSALNQEPFQNSLHGTQTFVVKMTSGSATLQALAGSSPNTSSDWVNVPDGAFSSSTVATLRLSAGVWFQWVLTGDAEVWRGA